MRLLLFLLLTFTAFAQPKVGFLRIYNCLSEEATFISYFNKVQLDLQPVKPGSISNTMMFKVGDHELFLKSKDFTIPPINVKIQEKQIITAVAFHLFNEETEELETKVLALSPQYNEDTAKGCIPLRIRSFSKSELFLTIADKKVVVPAMKSVDFNTWKGTSFNLENKGEFIKKLKPSDECPHTLLIWDSVDDKKDAILAPSFSLEIPKGLRDDLSFGRTRDQIPNLKTLQPRK